jgi:predicted peptidase
MKIHKERHMPQTVQAMNRRITKRVSCGYLLYLPRDYGKTKKLWPMILFLHGAGERGDDLELVKKHGPPKIVEKKGLPFIVVSPQCPAGQWWTNCNDMITALLDEVVAKYAVDQDKMYLTGLSMGGYGTWSLATECPERFAAIAPICGGGHRLVVNNLKNVPVWGFHGAKDTVVPIKESEEMVNTLKACGGNVKFTVYPKAAHDSWTKTYNNPRLYEWFLKQRRTRTLKRK